MTQPDGLVYFERVCIVSLLISGEVSHGRSFSWHKMNVLEDSRGCWAHISNCHVFSKLSVERNTGWWLVSTHLKYINSSNWESFPQVSRDENTKNVWVSPPPKKHLVSLHIHPFPPWSVGETYPSEALHLAEDLEAGTLQTGCHNIAHTNQGHDETQLFLLVFVFSHGVWDGFCGGLATGKILNNNVGLT